MASVAMARRIQMRTSVGAGGVGASFLFLVLLFTGGLFLLWRVRGLSLYYGVTALDVKRRWGAKLVGT